MQVVNFIFDHIIVSTTVNEDSDQEAAAEACQVLISYGLNPLEAYEVQINETTYDGALPGE